MKHIIYGLSKMFDFFGLIDSPARKRLKQWDKERKFIDYIDTLCDLSEKVFEYSTLGNKEELVRTYAERTEIKREFLEWFKNNK